MDDVQSVLKELKRSEKCTKLRWNHLLVVPLISKTLISEIEFGMKNNKNSHKEEYKIILHFPFLR